MQNVKIQTLWQLCQELKEKRQNLIEKLSSTQNYIDEQQNLINSELTSLRQHNNELSTNLVHLQGQIETFRQAWQSHLDEKEQVQSAPAELETYALRFERLAGELTFATLLVQSVLPEYLNDWAALGSEFDPFYRALHDLRSNPTADPSEFVQSAEGFIAGFQQSLASAREALAQSLNQAAASQVSAVDPAMQEKLEQLSQDYLTLQAGLDASEQELSAKESQLGIIYDVVKTIQREFDALREHNQTMSVDMKELTQQTDQLIGLVETYRQAALAAVSEAGLQAEAEATPAPETESEASDSDEAAEGSKADAVREAVRKKIIAVLRHRFGKVPRKVNNTLKEVNNSTKLDKLFEKALKLETMDEFEAELDA